MITRRVSAATRVSRTYPRRHGNGPALVIHTRDAEEDTMRILREETAGREGKLRGVLHCYSSNMELARFGLDIGFMSPFRA